MRVFSWFVVILCACLNYKTSAKLRQERKMDEAEAFIGFGNKIAAKAKRAIVF
jgi:hypothetical protein